MDFLEIYWTDFYKTGHKSMLPPGSMLMYSNFTPRSGKLAPWNKLGGVISIGQQMTVRKLKEDWDKNFFQRDISEIDQFGDDMTKALNLKVPYDTSHIKDLHKLGYLPLRIRSIKEGRLIPYRVPMFTIVNTMPIEKTIADWLVNYIETILSAESWQAPTSATLNYEFKRAGREYVMKTDPENLWFLDWKYHDFSMRGMGGKSSIVNSSMGFAVFSNGSDTLPCIPAARKYYDEKEPIIGSVIASEHAIMCTLTGFFMVNKNGNWEKVGDFEYETFLYLIKKFPDGILSLVMDTWDLWRAVTVYCIKAKDEILARDGKLVIRPDSGKPEDILCGTCTSPGMFHTTELKTIENNPEYFGLIYCLGEIFGTTLSSTGYKKLNPKIGAIYGDSITRERSLEIDSRMESIGYTTTNYVLGIGSYSLQYNTRDVHGFAQKATYVEIERRGETIGIEIFKDPATDSGVKKSAKGLLSVREDVDGNLFLKDMCSWDDERKGELQTIFEDGKFYNQTTFTEIRKEAAKLLEKELVVA